MVTIYDMVRAALQCDTAMSRAMLRACGIPVPNPPQPVGTMIPVSAYDGVEECFANRESPMDW